MTGNLSLEEISQRLHTAMNEFVDFCSGIDEKIFFYQPPDKWSIAQNVQHLIISAEKTKLAYSLPKFIIRLYVGKPNRPSRTYDELVAKYKLKLQQGGRASKNFIPKPIPSSIGKLKMLQGFSKAMAQLINSIQKNWDNNTLDNYIAPHPLLGKITLRELCYFTIHHTYHHLDTIKTRLAEFEPISA
jgi:hypothetical protein